MRSYHFENDTLFFDSLSQYDLENLQNLAISLKNSIFCFNPAKNGFTIFNTPFKKEIIEVIIAYLKQNQYIECNT